jgi:hypothetical protein
MTNETMPPLCTWPAVDTGQWPEPDAPFPVIVPYRPRPDLARLGASLHGRVESRVLDTDRLLADDLRAKWARLQALPERCVAVAPALAADPDGVWRRVRAAARAIADGQPQAGAPEGRAPSPPVLARVGDELHAAVAGWAMPADDRPFALRPLRADAVPVLRWIASRPAAERPLHALGLAVQPDLAWVESPAPGAPVIAALLHVCWPSGWDPAAKIGLDFAAIHAPVADGEMLRAASAGLSRALVDRGPLVRYVWTVTGSATRSRHPADAPEPPPGAAEAAWFRCERQVSLPLGAAAGPQATALFLIHLHVHPLLRVAAGPERRAVLLAALESMSDATLRYKRLETVREVLRRDWAGEA